MLMVKCFNFTMTHTTHSITGPSPHGNVCQNSAVTVDKCPRDDDLEAMYCLSHGLPRWVQVG